MAFDGYFALALANELNSLAGTRAERIFHNGSAVEILIYGEKQRFSLWISALPAAPFCAVRKEEERNSAAPTGFCSLLRKHLQPSRFTEVIALDNERVLRFSFDSRDELGHTRRRYLYAEIMGKFSNIVLTDESKVLGALSLSDLTASKRRLLSGFPYEPPPPQDKISALEINREKFIELCNKNPDKTVESFIISTFFAFSPLTAREIAFEACGDSAATVEFCGNQRLWEAFLKVLEIIKTKSFTPCAVFVKGKAIEFSYFPIKQYGKTAEARLYENFSELLNCYYGARETANALQQQANELLKITAARIAQVEKRLAAQRDDLAEYEKRDEYKKCGDLITANLYKFKQNEKAAICMDYETEKEIVITMDERISPAANAQRYYKKYQKYKTAAVISARRIEEGKLEKLYLESVCDCISRSETIRELAEIKDELSRGGYVKTQKAAKQKQKPLPPLTFTTTNGLTVRAGRNNLQNDELTKSAGKNDLWFHVRNAPGAHVILYIKDGEPADSDYNEAAEIAARHSSQNKNSVIEVDYARIKNVKKPSDAKPGFVIYSGHYTAVVKLTD